MQESPASENTFRPARAFGINHICLRVRDTQRSAAFYSGLFGLEEIAEQDRTDNTRACLLRDENGQVLFSLVLVEGLPPDDYLAGLDHFSLEVASLKDVERLYQQAQHRGLRATRPRVYEGRWQTFIFDPDGYKVEACLREEGCRTPGPMSGSDQNLTLKSHQPAQGNTGDYE